ncbi:MAG TPA: PIN domain nuclease [Rhizobiaceae bacterium]|nr:PIN domain nuclease [Rhizobiaceae bacterium]
MIVVDSSVWIAHFRDTQSTAVQQFRTLDPLNILIGDIILLEVLRGARDDLQAKRFQREFAEFDVVSMLDPHLSAIAATSYRRLRAIGITVRTVADLIIATYCIEHGHVLLHSDRDFTPFVEHLGLRVL